MKYFFLIISLLFISCVSEENLTLQENSKYQGKYEGTFSGDLSGTVIFEVSGTGGLEGNIYYNMPKSDEILSGYVFIDGKFNASTKSNLNFSGYLHDTTSNGMWNNGNLTGTYIFNKK